MSVKLLYRYTRHIQFIVKIIKYLVFGTQQIKFVFTHILTETLLLNTCCNVIIIDLNNTGRKSNNIPCLVKRINRIPTLHSFVQLPSL